MSPNEKEAQAEFRKVATQPRDPRDAGGRAPRPSASTPASKLPYIPFRIGVRKALAKGWKAVDTENFIVVHHSDNEKLINKIARDLEAIRPVYVDLFPPVKPVETVAIVRVCKNREEYLAYGGAPASGGYWHPGNEELVFYDYAQTELETEKKKGRRLTDKDSFVGPLPRGVPPVHPLRGGAGRSARLVQRGPRRLLQRRDHPAVRQRA